MPSTVLNVFRGRRSRVRYRILCLDCLAGSACAWNPGPSGHLPCHGPFSAYRTDRKRRRNCSRIDCLVGGLSDASDGQSAVRCLRHPHGLIDPCCSADRSAAGVNAAAIHSSSKRPRPVRARSRRRLFASACAMNASTNVCVSALPSERDRRGMASIVSMFGVLRFP